jgi:UDP-2-acetamido-2,6-beta-L-arabino-hexul-4-ose reductase
MKVLLTGGGGFLGWHTRARLRALWSYDVAVADRASWAQLADLVKGVDAVIHIAGVNRDDPAAVELGNIDLARDVATAIEASGGSPTIVFANSIQAGKASPYGVGKAAAEDILAAAAQRIGSVFVDVRLPNLFGEHGRPLYNSFVATFVDALLNGQTPTVSDRPVDLLHVQAAADRLIRAASFPSTTRLHPGGTATTVQQVFDKLQHFSQLYAFGDIPPLETDLDIDLFNTLRAASFPGRYPITLSSRTDDRGRLVEVVRAHGGQGQTFVSSTKPGITRGEHFHLRKMERFVVLNGEARISLRKLFTSDVVSFNVSGEEPRIVDMPTMWAHNITNVGRSELTTLFWTHELFDPVAPDTFAEPVSVVAPVDDAAA